MKIRVEIKNVPIQSIKPNPWNPNKQSEHVFEKEIKSIKKFGYLDPILVRKKKDGYEIIDGEHRWKAAKEIGTLEIPVNDLGEVSDLDAKQLTILMNEIRGKSETGLLSDLMKELEASLGMGGLLDVMPFTEMEIAGLVNIGGIDFDSLSRDPEELSKSPSHKESSDEFRSLTFNLPEGVADQLEAQIDRFKKALYPDEDRDGVSYVLPLEAMIQCLAQMEDDQLI